MQVPTEDRFLMRRTELLNKIATLLGGRAAEEIIFDDISTGAHNDLSRATDIARSMVKEYGMSRNLGQVYFAHDKQGHFFGPNQEGGGDYSAMTAHLIDKEIRQIIDEQYDRALNILNSNREILAQTAETLLENEVIEGDDLQVLADNISRKIDSDDGSGVIPEHQPLAA
jgi:cell division protease FtsH